MSTYTDDRIMPEFYSRSELGPWPNGGRMAVWIVLNVECWPSDYLGPGGMPWPSSPPDVPNSTYREYGNRVGVWRLISMLDKLSLPASIALNGAMCRFRPDIVEAFAARNWDIMGHGVDQSRALNRIPPEDEEGDIRSTLEEIETLTGKRPSGWLGPGLAQTAKTPDLLAEAGVRYIADRVDEQVPYYIRTGSRPLLSVPYSLDLNDYSAFAGMALTGWDYARMLTDQFDLLHEEATDALRVMCIPLHTYLSGVPHRSVHIAKALEHMKAQTDVWFATGMEIADAFEDLCGGSTADGSGAV